MRFRLFLLIFLSITLQGYAQNWELFPLNQKSYYLHTKDSTIHGLVADSMKIHFADHRVMYFNSKVIPCVQELKSSAIYTKPNHYIDSLIIKSDTAFIPLEGAVNPFIFLPKAKKGKSWNVYHKNGRFIDIECTEEKEEMIFGVLDSVKVFSIKSYVTLRNSKVTASDPSIFKLSKNFGLIHYVPFHEFVYVPTSTEVTKFQLLGLDNGSSKGYKLPGLHDYFKLNEGDVLLWKVYSEHVDWNVPDTYKYYRDSITKVFKEENSITYIYDRLTVLSNGDESTKTGIKDSFTLKDWGKRISSLPDWYYLHAESAGSFETLWYPRVNVNIAGSDTITHLQVSTEEHYMDIFNCEVNYIADVARSIKINTRVGVEEYFEFNFWSNTQTLIGSKISGKVTGTLEIPTGIKDKVAIRSINAFPNPAKDVLHIDYTSGSQNEYRILNALGVTVKEGILLSEELDISILHKGMYHLIIKGNDAIYRSSFVKE